MLITLNQLKTSLLAFKDWVLARIPSKTSDLTNDSDFVTTADIPTKVSDLVDDSGHYIKPSGGIPASDLASGVIPTVPVQDVTVNGTSVVSNKIAKIVLEDKFIWNMLVGTANPDVSIADKYPHIDGQGANTEITGIISTAEHGVRITKDEYGGLSINFGNGDSAFGLEPGTYTLSFDLWMKATTTFYGSLPHLTLTYEAGSQYKDVSTRDLTQAELGNDVNIGTVSITFTVNKYKYPRLSITTIYPDCFANGGYIELRNLMLNKGDGVLPWSPSLSEVMSEPPVQDVRIDGTSIVNEGIANIPMATANTFGVVKAETQYGLDPTRSGLRIFYAHDNVIKNASGVNSLYNPIVPASQHLSVFYGLAKAAGDTTQSASSNAVGTYTEEAKTAIRSMLDVPSVDDIPEAPVQDVQINGTSILNDGVANIPVASSSTLGVIKPNMTYGTWINNNGELFLSATEDSNIKAGINQYKPIPATKQHLAVFYGLAKAAGDTTQSASSNAVGAYTDEAKSAIKNMLGISEVQTVTVSDADPVITAVDNTRYVCGEVTSLSFTPCASGICDVIFTSGSTVAVLTLPNTVKMPDGFEVEANTTYEINILDGVYGSVMSWT